jgi:hypothetical protein
MKDATRARNLYRQLVGAVASSNASSLKDAVSVGDGRFPSDVAAGLVFAWPGRGASSARQGIVSLPSYAAGYTEPRSGDPHGIRARRITAGGTPSLSGYISVRGCESILLAAATRFGRQRAFRAIARVLTPGCRWPCALGECHGASAPAAGSRSSIGTGPNARWLAQVSTPPCRCSRSDSLVQRQSGSDGEGFGVPSRRIGGLVTFSSGDAGVPVTSGRYRYARSVGRRLGRQRLPTGTILSRNAVGMAVASVLLPLTCLRESRRRSRSGKDGAAQTYLIVGSVGVFWLRPRGPRTASGVLLGADHLTVARPSQLQDDTTWHS